VTRGRSVDHDEVVAAGLLQLLDLAQHDDVVDAGRRRGDHLDHPARGQAFGDATETVGLEILGQRRARRQRQALDVGADELGQRGLPVELDDEHTKSLFLCCSGQNCRYRCLPDATLAGNDGNVGIGQELQRILARRRHLCAG